MRTFIVGVTLYLLNHYIHDGFSTIAFALIFTGTVYCLAQDVREFAK